MTDVIFQRADYTEAAPDWKTCRDVVAGDRVIKSNGETYLPNPSTASKSSAEKDAAYETYKLRSLFYGVTAHTLAGLVGTAFKKKPVLTVPSSLEYIADNVDGSGVSIYQQSQATLVNVLERGRAGLLVDYPKTDGSTSKAAQLSGIRPSIILHEASSVTNWRTTKVGGLNKLSLVVISESYEETVGFGSESKQQFRVLQLIDGIYQVDIYRNSEGGWFIFDTYQPKDGKGQFWAEIPFTFVGSVNNDWRIDRPPILDLARTNIKHYQVGADWYNALHFAGMPQPTITGLPEQWRDHMEEKGVVLGSSAALLLPVGGDYKIATVGADTALQSELVAIEQRMVAIGARLIRKGGTIKTATEVRANSDIEHSVLSLAAENVSAAYSKALGWMSRFLKISEEVGYELSSDYAENNLDAPMLTALDGIGNGGNVPKSDLWTQYRKYGIIDSEKTDEQIKDELESDGGGLGLDD